MWSGDDLCKACSPAYDVSDLCWLLPLDLFPDDMAHDLHMSAEEQLKRLEGLSQEPVLFPDVVCQLHDMLHPAKEGEYTLRDLKRTKPQSALLFNAMFNLHKFLNYENRDPFAMRAEQGEFAGLTEWDKFAKVEYYRLASEDDHEDVAMEAEEQWQDAPMLDSLDRRQLGAKV